MNLPQFITDSPICAKCQGECCKNSPGICWPEDIEPFTPERIVQMVCHERYAIDWYEGDPRDVDRTYDSERFLSVVYWVRPAVAGSTKRLDPSWGGSCTFHAPTGCSLDPDNRPRQCLALVPTIGGDPVGSNCETVEGYENKEAAAFAWIPHQNMMQDAVRHLSS